MRTTLSFGTLTGRGLVCNEAPRLMTAGMLKSGWGVWGVCMRVFVWGKG